MAEKLTFKQALLNYTKATTDSMRWAKQCADMAILHFEEHGDLCYAQAFYDAIPNNYGRGVAFLKWMAEFSPMQVTSQGKKRVLSKDTVRAEKEGDDAFNTEKALETPYWDFAPDKEQYVYEEADVIKLMDRVVKRLENTEKSAPKDEAATRRVEMARKWVDTQLAVVTA
jgi:hypothetical protein